MIFKSTGQTSKITADSLDLDHIIKTTTSGFYASGTNSGNVCIIRLDDQLNVLWRKDFIDTLSIKHNNFLKQLPDHSMIAGGNWYHGPTPNPPGSFILHLDSTGNILFKQTYSDTMQVYNARMDQNGLIITGNSFNTSFQLYKFLVYKLDTLYQTNWAKETYASPYSEFPSFIFPKNSNESIVFSANPDGSDSKIVIDFVDSTGGRVLNKYWSFGGPGTLYFSVHYSNQNNYIISSLNPEYNQLSFNFFAVLNSSLNVLRQTGFRFMYNNGLLEGIDGIKSIPLSTGEIYAAGNIKGSANTKAILFFKLDQNLNIKWAYTIEDSTDAQLADISCTGSDNLVLLINKQGKSEIIIADTAGITSCVQNIFTNYTIVNTQAPYVVNSQAFMQDYTLPAQSYNAMPNTVNLLMADICQPVGIHKEQNKSEVYIQYSDQILNINFSDVKTGVIQISDVLGKPVITDNFSNSSLNFALTLDPGIYIVNICTNTNQIFSKKIFVE